MTIADYWHAFGLGASAVAGGRIMWNAMDAVGAKLNAWIARETARRQPPPTRPTRPHRRPFPPSGED